MDQVEVMDLWTIAAAVVAAAVSYGGTKHAVTSLKNDVDENRKMITTIQEEIKSNVSTKFCRIERQDCRNSRKESTEMLCKKLDDLSDKIDLQDQKRHDHANRIQGLYGDLLTRLSVLEGMIDERSRRFRKDDIV